MKKKVIILVVIAIFLVFLPQLFGMLGKGFYTYLLGKTSPGTWKIEKLSCRWFGKQTFKNIRCIEQEQVVFEAEELSFKGFFVVIFGLFKGSELSIKQGSLVVGNSFINPFDFRKITIENFTVYWMDQNIFVKQLEWDFSLFTFVGNQGEKKFSLFVSSKEIKANIDQFPLLFLDTVTHSSLFTTILGEYASLHVEEGVFKCQTPYLQAKGNLQFVHNQLSLQDVRLFAKVFPKAFALLGSFFPTSEQVVNLSLHAKSLELSKKHFAFLGHGSIHNLVLVKGQQKVDYKEIVFEGKENSFSVTSEKATAEINFAKDCAIKTNFFFPFTKEDTTQVTGDGVFGKKSVAKLKAISPHFTIHSSLDNSKLFIEGAGTTKEVPWTLQGKGKAKLSSHKRVRCAGTIHTSQGDIHYKIASGNYFQTASLKNTIGILKSTKYYLWEGKTQFYAFLQKNNSLVKGSYFQERFFGYKEVAQLTALSKGHNVWSIKTTGKKFATKPFSKKYPIQEIGKTIGWKIFGLYHGKVLTLEGKLAGDQIQCSLNAFVEGDTVQGMAKATCELTENRINTLVRLFYPEEHSRFFLTNASTMLINLEHFSFNRSNLDLCTSSVIGDFTIQDLRFIHLSSGQKIHAEQLQSTFSIDQETIEIKAEGNVVSSIVPKHEHPSFSISYMARDFCKDGVFNFASSDNSIEIQAYLFPIEAMMELFPIYPEQKEAIASFFGNLLNVSLIGNIRALQGEIHCNVQSSNAKIYLPLLMEKGTLYLKEDVFGEVNLTKQLHAWLKDVNPFLPTLAYSTNPVRLYIKKEGVVVPLFPFSFATVSIGQGVLNFGKMEVANTDNVRELFKFLKIPSTQEFVEVWTTPIFFSLHQGIIQYKRFDLLLDRETQMALWGQINLLQDSIKMSVALSARMLKKYFSLLAISKNAYFVIQIRGPISHPRIDWSHIYARMAILVARLAGGYMGYFIGGVVEQALGLNDEKVPAATTDPFPWNVEEEKDPSLFPEESTTTKKESNIEKAFKFLVP